MKLWVIYELPTDVGYLVLERKVVGVPYSPWSGTHAKSQGPCSSAIDNEAERTVSAPNVQVFDVIVCSSELSGVTCVHRPCWLWSVATLSPLHTNQPNASPPVARTVVLRHVGQQSGHLP